MLGHRPFTVDDYLGILRRRLWIIVVPALLVPAAALGISFLVAEEYTSLTLVLVEQQRVPESFVKSVVTDELNQRLGTMREQILSRTRLQPIIERFGLYKKDVGKVPMEELVNELRKAIEVTPVKPVVTSRADELPGFYISVTASEARTAQQVCAEITSMFMEENLKVREQRAQDTTQFLQKQVDEAKLRLDDQDRKLAAFKQRYIGQLPGQEQTNMSLLMGMTSQLDAVNQVLSRAQSDKTYLESLLAQQLSSLEASKLAGDPERLEEQLERLRNELLTLEARYTKEHPDVIKARADIAQLERKIQESRSQPRPPQPAAERVAVNEPAELTQLRSQIHVAEVTIREKTKEQERLKGQIQLLQARVQLSPVVEQQFKELTRDYETALEFYNELLSKKAQSEMATNLEKRQQGEQFRVMDPPNLPERPTFPNRPLFAGGGLAAGLALGVGLALLLEALDKSLRSERDIEAVLEVPTLALVPFVHPPESKSGRLWTRASASGLGGIRRSA